MSTPIDAPLLHQMRFSHYNEKGRWALDYKEIPHRRQSALPGLHVARAKRLYGGDKYPVLVLDGKAIGGTDHIVKALEERWPERSLYPEHPVQKRLALELEQEFDEHLGAQIRRMLFFYLLPNGRETSALFTQGFSGPTRAGYRAAFPALRPVFRRVMQVDAEGAEDGRRATLAALDRIESEIGSSGYLVGDSFSVADLTAASLMFPLVRPAQGFQYQLPEHWPEPWEEFRASVADRDGFKWVDEMWRRHRGSSAEIPA